MKKLFLSFFGLHIMASLVSQTKPVQELAPGVYYYFGDELQHKPANCLWVVFKDYVLVIDANYPWGRRRFCGRYERQRQSLYDLFSIRTITTITALATVCLL